MNLAKKPNGTSDDEIVEIDVVAVRMKCLKLALECMDKGEIASGHGVTLATEFAAFVIEAKIQRRGVFLDVTETETGKLVTLRSKGVEHRVEFTN